MGIFTSFCCKHAKKDSLCGACIISFNYQCNSNICNYKLCLKIMYFIIGALAEMSIFKKSCTVLVISMLHCTAINHLKNKCISHTQHLLSKESKKYTKINRKPLMPVGLVIWYLLILSSVGW